MGTRKSQIQSLHSPSPRRRPSRRAPRSRLIRSAHFRGRGCSMHPRAKRRACKRGLISSAAVHRPTVGWVNIAACIKDFNCFLSPPCTSLPLSSRRGSEMRHALSVASSLTEKPLSSNPLTARQSYATHTGKGYVSAETRIVTFRHILKSHCRSVAERSANICFTHRETIATCMCTSYISWLFLSPSHHHVQIDVCPSLFITTFPYGEWLPSLDA